jgi:hypothetical protein
VVDVINPALHENWDHLISGLPGSTVFHTSAWASVLSECYRYSPVYFSLLGDNRLRAVLPVMDVKSVLTGRRGVSLPFTDFCEPCVPDRSVFEDLMNEAIEYGRTRKWKFIELRGGGDILTGAAPCAIFYNHHLTLSTDWEPILAKCRRGTKSSIHKAGREGVEVRVSSSLEFLDSFYGLHCITRKRHGLPPQPYRFFKLLHEKVLSSNMGLIVLAFLHDTPIAGIVCLHGSDRAIYKYGASDLRYQHLRANNIVMWEAIKWYCHRGYKTFSFGRTEPENSGLRMFKTSWGAEETVFNYYRYDIRKAAFVRPREQVTGLEKAIFGRLPVPVLKLLGLLLYRHMG